MSLYSNDGRHFGRPFVSEYVVNEICQRLEVPVIQVVRPHRDRSFGVDIFFVHVLPELLFPPASVVAVAGVPEKILAVQRPVFCQLCSAVNYPCVWILHFVFCLSVKFI